MSEKDPYNSALQRKRSANSPWRHGSHCDTHRAKAAFLALKPRPAPRRKK